MNTVPTTYVPPHSMPTSGLQIPGFPCHHPSNFSPSHAYRLCHRSKQRCARRMHCPWKNTRTLKKLLSDSYVRSIQHPPHVSYFFLNGFVLVVIQRHQRNLYLLFPLSILSTSVYSRLHRSDVLPSLTCGFMIIRFSRDPISSSICRGKKPVTKSATGYFLSRTPSVFSRPANVPNTGKCMAGGEFY